MAGREGGSFSLIDGVLAALGLALNAVLGWWWAGPAAGTSWVYYAIREVREIITSGH